MQRGILGAVKRAVNGPKETMGYAALLEQGLQRFAFNSVEVRRPEVLSLEAIQRSIERTTVGSRVIDRPHFSRGLSSYRTRYQRGGGSHRSADSVVSARHVVAKAREVALRRSVLRKRTRR